MSSWRRKALAFFPDLRRDLVQPYCTVGTIFVTLLPRVREAHIHNDVETLRRIYGFAEWCLEQNARALWNSAGVSFYEHLFDGPCSLWNEVVQWLSPQVMQNCWGLWEARLSPDDLAEVRRLFACRRKTMYQDARLSKSPR